MNLKKQEFVNIMFHDTETTGVDPEDRIIESAYIYFDKNGSMVYKEELNKAPVKIKPAAAMTHGYTNKMVEGKPSFSDTEGTTFLKERATDTFYVAHNASFDINMLSKEGIEWEPSLVIDTLRVSQHMYKDNEEVEMFKLQYFRYLFEFDDQPWFKDAMAMLNLKEIKPHTALSDIFILWLFYAKMREDFNLSNEDMVRLSQTPVEETYVNFGNVFEKGVVTFDEAVRTVYSQYGKSKKGYDYLDWAVNNMSMAIDREYSIRKAMAKGIIDGVIPNSKKYQSYLYWGILYSFNKKEINKGISLLGQSGIFAEFLYNTAIKNFNKYVEEYNSKEEISGEEENEFKKKTFLNNFLQRYRREILL